MENMQRWYRTNASTEGNIDCLMRETLKHAQHASKEFLDGHADQEWCDLYMATFFPMQTDDSGEESPLPCVCDVPRTCESFNPYRFSMKNIVLYLWNRHSDPSVDMTQNPDTIPMLAIEFIHGKYVCGYSPDKTGESISRGRFMGLGIFEEAWTYICTNFLETARPLEYRKWVVASIRDYAENLVAISPQHQLKINLCADDEYSIEEQLNMSLYAFRQSHIPSSFAETRAALIAALDPALYRLNQIMGIGPPLDQHIFDDRAVYSLFADIVNADIIEIQTFMR